MELQGVIRAQANVKTCPEEVRQRVTLVRQEQCIIAEGAHRNANLFQIEQILQSRNLTQQDAMRDRMGRQKGRR